ncbi:MAG: molybdenum cofactor biosynthesis protein MoaE [Thermoanaerobaculia bacterium]
MPWLSDERIDRDALVQSVLRDSDGAVALFEGVVRNRHEGHDVESIFYECYRPMAEKEIDRIVRTVSGRHPEVRSTLVHRLGEIRVGEASIVIVCVSPHRADAFAACRELIDEVKRTVPIWKKERTPEGEIWVGMQNAPGEKI